MTERTCSIPGCTRRVKARGWCLPHYKRWWRNGDPLAGNATHKAPLAWLIEAVATRDRSTGCWEWPFGRARSGYGRVFHPDGERRQAFAHRVAVELDGRAIPDGHYVRHSCDNRGCVNPAHLVVGAPRENSLDTVYRNYAGTQRLRPADALAIRSSSEDPNVLSARYGVSRNTVVAIKNGRAWAHLGTTRNVDGTEIPVVDATTPERSAV